LSLAGSAVADDPGSTPAPAPDPAPANASEPAPAPTAEAAPVGPIYRDAAGIPIDKELEAWTVSESLTSVELELDDIYQPRDAMIEIPGFDSLIDKIIAGSNQLNDATGLRLGVAYTMIFQQASGGPGYRSGASGDLDIMGSWTALGRGTPNTGELIFSVEERFAIGYQPASALRGVLGTLNAPTNGFNDRGFVVRDFYWLQRVFDGKLGLALGRGDTSDFFGGHRMQSLNVSFSNRSFSANTVIPSPGHGLFTGFSVRPIDQFYATAGVANAYGSTTINDMQYLDEWKFFYFGEFGFTPMIDGVGPGRYRVVLWHIDSRDIRTETPSDSGYSIIADQDIGERFMVFARFGQAENGDVTGIKWAAEGGGGIRGLLGATSNMTGLAFSYSAPSADGSPDEKVIECFHRFQLTRHTQLSVGVQGIFDPSNSPDTDALAVFTARFRIVF